jgi:predicted nucleic acid-binding Zn ribbon protein
MSPNDSDNDSDATLAYACEACGSIRDLPRSTASDGETYFAHCETCGADRLLSVVDTDALADAAISRFVA